MDEFGFTREEWQSVRSAPWVVGSAVIDTEGGSPVSVLREIGAVDRQIDQAYRSTEHCDLVKTIAYELRDAPASEPLVEPERLAAWDEQLRDILEIIDAKTAGAENRDFREWLYEIAVDTADAARDHWRVRGPRVSEEEQDLLNELAAMLDVG